MLSAETRWTTCSESSDQAEDSPAYSLVLDGKDRSVLVVFRCLKAISVAFTISIPMDSNARSSNGMIGSQYQILGVSVHG